MQLRSRQTKHEVSGRYDVSTPRRECDAAVQLCYTCRSHRNQRTDEHPASPRQPLTTDYKRTYLYSPQTRHPKTGRRHDTASTGRVPKATQHAEVIRRRSRRETIPAEALVPNTMAELPNGVPLTAPIGPTHHHLLPSPNRNAQIQSRRSGLAQDKKNFGTCVGGWRKSTHSKSFRPPTFTPPKAKIIAAWPCL